MVAARGHLATNSAGGDFANRLPGDSLRDCCAEFPPEEELLDAAMSGLVGQAHRLFLPWQEVADLYFFDDKDCNLKTAPAFMKAGNLEAALQPSLTNVETCKATPKVKDKNLFHANYNEGMGYFATGQFDKALEYLNAAQQAKPADITTESIGRSTGTIGKASGGAGPVRQGRPVDRGTPSEARRAAQEGPDHEGRLRPEEGGAAEGAVSQGRHL